MNSVSGVIYSVNAVELRKFSKSTLADVESKIASAEEKGIEQGIKLATKNIAINLAKA